MKKFFCLIIPVFLCLTLFSSCEKDVHKETRVIDGSEDSEASLPVTTIKVSDKIGPLLKPYDDLISGGEYTLKMTVNEIIGGESVPVVTTSVHHGETMKIKIEESYGFETVYYVDGSVLYYYTGDGEIRSLEYDPGVLNVYLYSSYMSAHELVDSGEMTLYGREYSYEKYIDNCGAETAFLFYGTSLERKLVYDGSGDHTVYTVELTENSEATDIVF